VIKVLPLVALVAAAKVAVAVLGWEAIELSPLFTGLVAANVFLLGFLLAGTLADYKESERLPGELAASVETIADECQILDEDKGAGAARACLAHLRRLVTVLDDWFNQREGFDAVLEAIRGLNPYFLAFEPLTQPNFIVRLKQEQAAIRRMVIRITTIRETSFVGAGYAIAELTSALLVAGLILVDISPVGEALFFVCMISFLLAYMIALIRDLDDPFEYGNGRRGSAEVSLKPVRRIGERLDGMLSAADR
jgi:hypothetical protein